MDHSDYIKKYGPVRGAIIAQANERLEAAEAEARKIESRLQTLRLRIRRERGIIEQEIVDHTEDEDAPEHVDGLQYGLEG